MSTGTNGGGWVGRGLARKEDNRLLRGRGKFVDDIKLLNMLYLKFVRSPFAHAKVTSVNTSAAEAVPGVICTLTGAEIAKQTNPFIEIGPDPFARIKDYPLAVSKVRFQGEPVAAVVATSPQKTKFGAASSNMATSKRRFEKRRTSCASTRCIFTVFPARPWRTTR